MLDRLYNDEQRENIRMGLHPDCGTKPACLACGATEEVGGGACAGKLGGTEKDLFEVANMWDYNATLVSLGYNPFNRKSMAETARVCDIAARELFDS
jgi:hypothetical protein